MPHYFIDIVEDTYRTSDEVGLDLVDMAAARREAMLILIELARDEAREGNFEALSVEVRNHVGQPKFHATLRFELRDEA